MRGPSSAWSSRPYSCDDMAGARGEESAAGRVLQRRTVQRQHEVRGRPQQDRLDPGRLDFGAGAVLKTSGWEQRSPATTSASLLAPGPACRCVCIARCPRRPARPPWASAPFARARRPHRRLLAPPGRFHMEAVAVVGCEIRQRPRATHEPLLPAEYQHAASICPRQLKCPPLRCWT